MRLLLSTLGIVLVAVTVGAVTVGAAPLGAQQAAPVRLLGEPGAAGTCSVARVRMGTLAADSGTTRTLTVVEADKTVRRIAITEDARGRVTHVSDVMLSSMENVDVRFGAAQPRVSWHTTSDTGMADPAAVAAAQRLTSAIQRRCPGR